eukprot:g8276.t1
MENETTAMLFYTDTSEEEEVDLAELVQEKQIAFLEIRALDYELKEDEMAAENLISAPSARSASDETDVEDDDEEEREESVREGSSGALLHHQDNNREEEEEEEGAMLKGFARPGLSKTQSFPEDVPDSMGLKSPEEFLIPGDQLKGAFGGTGLEQLNPQGVVVLGSSKSAPSADSSLMIGPSQHYDLLRRKRQFQEGLMRSSSYETTSFKMTAVREKIIEQLKADLEIAKAEQRKETEMELEQDTDSTIKDLATAIEFEILKLCGGENTEYKNKFRTLHFNLKDSRNPELRGQVLDGVISPERLVNMTPQELASQELSQWRQKKAEELLKATVLDEEAAAKFSTAAALKQLDSRREKRLKEETHDPGSLADIVEVSTVLPASVESEAIDEFDEQDNDSQTRLSPGALRLADEAQTTNLSQLEAAQLSIQPSVEVTENVISEARTPSKVESVSVETTEAMDVDGVPDWAEEVLEDPTTGSVFVDSTPVENVPTPLVLYSPKAAEERNEVGFGPVPIETKPAPVGDLTPLILKGEFSDSLGDTIWEGQVAFGEHHSFKAQCQAIAGKCSLKEILSSTQVTVQGRMNLKKVEEFLEKLRMSKSRSVTIGILKSPTDASESDISAIQHQVTYHQSRERTGAISFGEGLEGYLIPRCLLTERLLLTAKILLENEAVPANVESNEFLLVVVHKKDWASQKNILTPPPPPPPEPMVSDPRLRAGLKPIMEPPPPPPVLSTGAAPPESILPAGLTLESISSLAAMLGVQNQSRPPPAPTPPALQQQSMAVQQQSIVPPHQMTVPTPPISSTFENQQHAAIAALQMPKQIERPKFLIFDPVTNKAVPINPASVQYDPTTNRVVMVGPLPPGFSTPQQQMMPTGSIEMQTTSENLISNAPGVVPLMNKQRQGEGLGEGLVESLGQTGGGAIGRLQQSVGGPGMLGRMMKPNFQQMSTDRGSFRGRGNNFRRGGAGGRSTGRFDISFPNSNLHGGTSPMQPFPDSDAL